LLADRSANWAEWDSELLALELGDLNALGFDLSLTGFGELELGLLLAGGFKPEMPIIDRPSDSATIGIRKPNSRIAPTI
jgi:hypothetical protein